MNINSVRLASNASLFDSLRQSERSRLAVRGDFKDDDGSYSDTVGKMVGGLVPGVSDARDLIADGKRVSDGEKGSYLKLGATLLGAVPIIGDVGKGVIKAEEKAIVKGLEKSAEKEIIEESGEKIAKAEAERLAKTEVERISERYDEISKSGHPVQRHGEAITESQLDDRAMYGKDPLTGTTDDAYRKNPDGTPKPHNFGKDATKFISEESLVKAESYVKNSQKFKDELTEVDLLGGNKIVIKDIKLKDIYGTNYKDQVFGKTRIGTKNNPTGTVKTDFTDGSVRAVYEKDAKGNWKLETMFPEPKN